MESASRCGEWGPVSVTKEDDGRPRKRNRKSGRSLTYGNYGEEGEEGDESGGDEGGDGTEYGPGTDAGWIPVETSRTWSGSISGNMAGESYSSSDSGSGELEQMPDPDPAPASAVPQPIDETTASLAANAGNPSPAPGPTSLVDSGITPNGNTWALYSDGVNCTYIETDPNGNLIAERTGTLKKTTSEAIDETEQTIAGVKDQDGQAFFQIPPEPVMTDWPAGPLTDPQRVPTVLRGLPEGYTFTARGPNQGIEIYDKDRRLVAVYLPGSGTLYLVQDRRYVKADLGEWLKQFEPKDELQTGDIATWHGPSQLEAAAMVGPALFELGGFVAEQLALTYGFGAGVKTISFGRNAAGQLVARINGKEKVITGKLLKKTKSLLSRFRRNPAAKNALAEIDDLARASAPEHHVATNKNWISSVRGGPWSPRFERIFKKAGMTLDDAANKVRVSGHVGPHPEAYHREVFNRLRRATRGLTGDAYKTALLNELEVIAREARTVGSRLNDLLTGN